MGIGGKVSLNCQSLHLAKRCASLSMDKIKSIKSNSIRAISTFLANNGCLVTYFGKPWSNVDSNWIYFDSVLNINELIIQFDEDKTLEIHENTDPRSGLEKGLIDSITKEAVMGLVK